MKYLVFFAFAVSASAQATDGDKLVTVPQRYVSAEGLSHQAEAETSKWIGIGREIGIATREGLGSVVDVSEKFGTTNVGHFVMFMVAWRVIGKDILRVVLGIPIWIAGVAIWMWSMRRFFFGRQVLLKSEKGVKEWVTQPAYKFGSDEARAGCGGVHAAVIAVWCIAMLCVVFA